MNEVQFERLMVALFNDREQNRGVPQADDPVSMYNYEGVIPSLVSALWTGLVDGKWSGEGVAGAIRRLSDPKGPFEEMGETIAEAIREGFAEVAAALRGEPGAEAAKKADN